tara:strand:- start:13956 stop:14966 length:1011 start_codon:yes stop_codon:yes gene_type:complete
MKNYIFNILSSMIEKNSIFHSAISHFENKSLRIIFYHTVTDNKRNYYFNSFNIATFKKQIKFFKKHYNIISLNEAIERANNNKSLEKCLVITFDDGFSECYTTIAPILLEENISATFYVISDVIDNADMMWRNKLIYLESCLDKKKINKIKQAFSNKYKNILHIIDKSLLEFSDYWNYLSIKNNVNIIWDIVSDEPLKDFLEKNKPYLTSSQIIDLHNSGFTIGSHSKSHPRFNVLKLNEIKDEISGSINTIFEKTNIKVDSFSYPFGIRAAPKFEEDIINSNQLKSILGIKNSFRNYRDTFSWERDYLEYPNNQAISRFFIKPIINRMKSSLFTR